MNPIWLLLGGIVIAGTGYFIGMLVSRNAVQGQAVELTTTRQQLNGFLFERDALLSEKSTWQQNQLDWVKKEEQVNGDLRHAQSTIERLSTHATTLESDLKDLNGSNNRVIEDRARLESQLVALKTQLDENQSQWKTLWEEKLQNYLTKELDGTREHLKTLAKAEDEQRHEKFEDLVKPVKDMLDSYQEKLTQMDVGYQKQMAVVSDQVTGLMKAKNDLVSVLKHNKGAGDWGELQLLRILEHAGLQETIHYEFQPTVSAGKRPDVKVLLPRERYIIVDSKALQWSNRNFDGVATDSEQAPVENDDLTAAEKSEARGKALVRSIKTAADDLHKKNYTEGKFNESPDFVVLFLPQESMLSNALETDPNLWETAWQKQVLLTSPLTLVALLRMIATGWQQDKLTQNLQAVMEVGQKVHERVLLMAERIVTIEKQYDTLGKSIGKMKSTYEGNKGLIKAAQEMQELGVQSGKSIPSEMEDAPYRMESSDNEPPVLESVLSAE